MPRYRRLDKIVSTLESTYPDAHCALHFKTPLQLLIATILSAQSTDKRVNMVTPAFFDHYPHPQALAGASLDAIGELIHSTGFFNAKSKSLKGMAQMVVSEFGGEIPGNMNDLIRLPGVGRKTANVILGNAFGVPGVVVDTHMLRLNNLLGLVSGRDAVQVERALMALLPAEEWTMYSHRIIEHGRAICIARRPQCRECVLNDLCPSAQVFD